MHMRQLHRALSLVLALLVMAASWTFAQDESTLANPSDADWIMSRRTYSGWGHSPLDQINTSNVANLTLAWAAGMTAGGVESTPLVYNGVMYLPMPQDTIRALDGATGDLVWEYRRDIPDRSEVTTLGGTENVRNIAIYDGKIFHSTFDANIIALDAATGQLLWETEVGDYRVIGHSSGPLVVNGVVVSGRSCDPALPGGCFLAGHAADNGEELWRTYLIPRPGEPGGDTWGDLPTESRLHVGAWGNVGAFDPELGLLYWGTSVPAPSPEVMRGTVGEDVLYSNSTLAIRPETGELVWYYQHLPRDNWDFDHPFERMLIDTEVAPNPSEVAWINPDVTPGRVYKTLTNIPGKTGIIYSLDRETGEFLWARPTVMQNVVTEILPNGRVIVNEEVIPDSIDDPYGMVCPTVGGGRDWMAGAYNPGTNAIYQGLANVCMMPEIFTDEWTPEDLYGITYPFIMAPGETYLGTLRAYSAETGEELWKYEQEQAITSLLSTGGGLIFAGDADRRFRAWDAATGEVLWESILGAGVGGFPISYDVDGVQYVAVPAGGFGFAGLYNQATGLPLPPSGSNVVYVFKLGN